MNIATLTDRYLELVIADQSDGPCKVTEECYAAFDRALLSDGQTIARAFGIGGWLPSVQDDPYQDINALELAARRARDLAWPSSVFISDVNHNGAMLGNDALNLAFRAHHDAVHVLEHAEMNLQGETLVALRTIERLFLGPRTTAVITAEIVGQSLFYERYKRFPLVDGRQPFARSSAELVDWAHDCYEIILGFQPYNNRGRES